jgi:hypothetical protein
MACCSTVGRMNMEEGISCLWLSSDVPSSSGNSCQKPFCFLKILLDIIFTLYCVNMIDAGRFQ